MHPPSPPADLEAFSDKIIANVGATGRPRAIAARGKLFHATNGVGQITPAWYSRVRWEDHRHYLALGTDEQQAQWLDQQARLKLREGHADIRAVKAWLAEQIKPRPAAAPFVPAKTASAATSGTSSDPNPVTLRDIVKTHAATYFEAQPETTHRYRASLLNLVETAIRHRQGLPPLKRPGKRVGLGDYAGILDLPATILDDTLVADFQAARLAGCPRRSPQELSAKRSANTELRQARCIFSAEAKITYWKAKLILSDLTSFLTAPRFKSVLCHPRLPTDVTLDNLFSALSALRHEHEPIFTAVALALYAGLRRAEIFHAKLTWLNSSSGSAVRIQLEEGFRPKNSTERTIPIPQWLFDHLQQASPHAYLGLTDGKCRTAILQQAVAWLRNHGFQTYRKPLHSLRALYTAYLLATEPNPFRIKTRLGHADLSTTFRYYADEPLADHYCTRWQVAVA